MKKIRKEITNKAWMHAFLIFSLIACVPGGNKNSKNEKMEINGFEKGSYGYDKAFFQKNNIETIELQSKNSEAKVLIVPAYQGRVMTSSASGEKGGSFGWINHDLIKSGEIRKHINPVGGEERFWLGPEGGPFSIYFNPGEEQVFENWQVPAVLDTEKFDVREQKDNSVTFTKSTKLQNASGTHFDLDIKRTVSLLSKDTLSELFRAGFSSGSLDIVAYQSENTITNTGEKAWTKDEGLLSIWILSMFNPSPETTVFIPFETDATGPVVNDDYFGKVPSDRLIIGDSTIFFKTDGKYRSKIGVPPERAKELCGSYDYKKQILTLVWGSLPEGKKAYVNSKWGDQDDPYDGDAVNAYNDGPVEDGSILGPFYEIETSSPGAKLNPGESLTHIQRVIHVQGDEQNIAELVDQLFGLKLETIAGKFR